MKIRVTDYIVKYLEDLGIHKIFLLSGGGMMHLVDSAGRQEKLGYISQHHEQACAMAAEGYARQSGGLGVCFATSGPGATNTLTGILGAWVDSTPLLVVTGQSKLSQTIRHSELFGLRQFGTFECDIIPMAKSITKYAVFLDHPSRVRFELEKAISLATTGRPGPVLIDIPIDIQGSLIDPSELEGYTAAESEKLFPSEKIVDSIMRRLTSAKRPLILAGHGVRAGGCAELFQNWIKSLNVPVVTTPLAADLLCYDDQLYIGHPGMKGDRAGNFAIQSADVILSLGCSFHVLTTGYELGEFAPKAYKIQVELDEFVLKREQIGVQEKVLAGVREFIETAQLVQNKTDQKLLPTGKWHRRCQQWKEELAVNKENHKRVGEVIQYYDLNHVLGELSLEGDTIVTDAGSAFYVIGQAFPTKKNQRIIISGGLGSMGYALPASTGAALAKGNGGRVLCVTGDGSLQTNIHELAVIAYHKLNIKVIVPNNGGYVSIRNTQNNFFKGHLVGTDEKSGLFFPSLEKIASAYEIPYFSVGKIGDLSQVIQQALQVKGPVICEVYTSFEQEIIPTVTSVKRSDGSMKSKPLQEMSPFLEDSVLKAYLSDLE